jgi:hypothetical protein
VSFKKKKRQELYYSSGRNKTDYNLEVTTIKSGNKPSKATTKKGKPKDRPPTDGRGQKQATETYEQHNNII